MANPIVPIGAVLFGTLLLVAMPHSAFAQGTVVQRIVRIRQQYEAIDAPSKHYTIRKHESTYETGSDTYTGFYENRDLRKIVVISSGEYDQVTTKFYLQGGHVFFIHRITTRFKTLGDNKGTSSEQRFYFAQDSLIRWLGADNVAKPVDSTEARAAAHELLAVSRNATGVLVKSKKE